MKLFLLKIKAIIFFILYKEKINLINYSEYLENGKCIDTNNGISYYNKGDHWLRVSYTYNCKLIHHTGTLEELIKLSLQEKEEKEKFNLYIKKKIDEKTAKNID